MGLLDDMVKLQWGAPMREGLGAIGQGIREKKAEEALMPIINEFANEYQDAKNIPTIASTTNPQQQVVDVQSIQNRLASALGGGKGGTVISPSMMNTQAFKSAKENIVSISDAILKGATTAAGLEKARADTREITAKANEQLSATSFLDTKTVPENARWAPKEMWGKTYRQYLAQSKADEPYIRWDETSMRLGIAQKDMLKPVQEFKNRYLIPALGPEATNLKSNIDQLILDNDINGIVKEVMKGTTSKDYVQIRGLVENAFKQYNLEGRADQMRAFTIIQSQAEEMYKSYIETLPPGTPAVNHDLWINSKMRELGKMAGLPELDQLSGMAQEAASYRTGGGGATAQPPPTSTGGTTIPSWMVPTTAPLDTEEIKRQRRDENKRYSDSSVGEWLTNGLGIKISQPLK